MGYGFTRNCCKALGDSWMIYLFDNCFLDIPDDIDEQAKHVWIGEFDYPEDELLGYVFNIHQKMNSITPSKIESLFKDIHKNLSSDKVILYCDVPSFQKVYAYFFGAVLSKEGLKQLYQYDRDKHNYRISSNLDNNLFRYKHQTLPEDLKVTTSFSEFAKTCDLRIEIALANYFLDGSLKEYCFNRLLNFTNTNKGIPKQQLYNIYPLFVNSSISEVDFEKFVDELYLNQEIVGVDILKEYTGVNKWQLNINNSCDNPDYVYQDVISSTKEQHIEKYVLSKEYSELMFNSLPFPKNYDSVNPILFKQVYKNCNNQKWLEAFKLNYGTDNQTDGTV